MFSIDLMTLTATQPQTASRITPADRKLFRGTAAEVQPWMSTQEILASINSDFRVLSLPARIGERTYEDCRLWIRNDNNNLLGHFGPRRQVLQPTSFVDYFKAFCDASNKQLSLDLVGSLDGGKTFYMASKLTDNTHALLDSTLGGGYGVGGGLGISRRGSSSYIASEDRTDFWLVLTDYYGESLSPKATIFANELICSNGLARRVTDSEVKLTHRTQLTYDMIAPVIQRALEQSRAYTHMKERLITTPISMDTARQALRQFFNDTDGETKTVKRLEQIYTNNLIGGELSTRQGNLWRLASAVTQYTSHERAGRDQAGCERTLRSQLEGSRNRTNQRFMDFLESQFLGAGDRQLAHA